jgi:hypothetical protein
MIASLSTGGRVQPDQIDAGCCHWTQLVIPDLPTTSSVSLPVSSSA